MTYGYLNQASTDLQKRTSNMHTVSVPLSAAGGGGGQLSVPNIEKGGSEKNKCLGGT